MTQVITKKIGKTIAAIALMLTLVGGFVGLSGVASAHTTHVTQAQVQTQATQANMPQSCLPYFYPTLLHVGWYSYYGTYVSHCAIQMANSQGANLAADGVSTFAAKYGEPGWATALVVWGLKVEAWYMGHVDRGNGVYLTWFGVWPA